MSESREQRIKDILMGLGAEVCGIANVSRFMDIPKGFSPVDVYGECKSVIVFGKALSKGLFAVGPRILYGHFNYFMCDVLDGISLEAAGRIERETGGIAIPIPSDSPYEYWEPENLHGHGTISMKHAAVLAGVGSMGKNTILTNKEFGNRLVLSAILTNLDLESDPLAEPVCINGCTKCIDSCPVGAIKDGIVNQKLCRNNVNGKTKRGFNTMECNICRRVCPMGLGE